MVSVNTEMGGPLREGVVGVESAHHSRAGVPARGGKGPVKGTWRQNRDKSRGTIAGRLGTEWIGS